MRLHYARTVGLIGIPRSEIDFDELPGNARTVAIVADNGTGKSTLLGATYAAIHLEMPDRPGNLVDQFQGQGEVELIWSFGCHRYRSLVKVEGRQKEAFLFVDGETKSRSGGGVSKYLAVVQAEATALETGIKSLREQLASARQSAEALAKVGRQRAAIEAEREAKDRQIQKAQERLGELKGQIRTLEALSAEIDQADDDCAAASERFSVYHHLARAFGEEGIQTLKIDAAGPEVSGLTNKLLSTCYGPRFAVQFETQRARLSRDGMAEDFDIRILDTERGSALFDAKSGGERVILGEALALGLSLFKSLRSGQRVETLIRDEADGALSPERAQRYLEMLGRAAEIGEFHRLLFVSHRQEIWEQADARLFLRPDGTFTVG